MKEISSKYKKYTKTKPTITTPDIKVCLKNVSFTEE